jgi:hypothetical protein
MSIQAALVRSILERHQHYEWTVQGFGFARTKIADVGRIHVWDPRLAVPLVSTMHAHPWPLRSTIISGELINQRWHRAGLQVRAPIYTHSRIKTGEGGGLTGETIDVRMIPLGDPEFYLSGDVYEQQPEEVHRTIAEPGTVTLLERPHGPPLQETDVYWPQGTEWVSAEPKPADAWLLASVIAYALKRWNLASCALNAEKS